MTGRLDGKVAVITGATAGIGARTAEVFAAEGASVVIAARRAELGEALAARLGEAAAFKRTDVTDEADVEAMIDFAVDRYGRLDCLFNNAGSPAPTGSIADVPLERYEAAMAVLLRSVFLGLKHATPVMKAQGAGSIINCGSVAGLRVGLSSSMLYGFGKAAGLPDDKAERTAETVKAALSAFQPIPRAGLPDDIAHAAVYLASDDSTFVNGHDLVVDGGVTAGRKWSDSEAARRQLGAALRASVEG